MVTSFYTAKAVKETSRITGANRDYINKRIPHLSSRLVSTLDELIEHSEILLITRDGDIRQSGLVPVIW